MSHPSSDEGEFLGLEESMSFAEDVALREPGTVVQLQLPLNFEGNHKELHAES